MNGEIPAWESFQGRPAPHAGMKIRLYKNLNRQHRFSLMAMEGPLKGRVLGYTPAALVRDIEMKISHGGRNRVLNEGVRNVHATCLCTFEAMATEAPATSLPENPRRVTYQPFLRGHF